MMYIFDWDGTLCDSTGKIIDCVQKAAVTVSLPALADHLVKDIIGLGLKEAILKLYPDLDDNRVKALTQAYSEHFIASDHIPCPLFDGAEELLHRLRDDGIHLTVATGKSRRGLDRVLTSLGMEKFFDGSRCADETASKPDPLMLHQLLEEFNKHHEQAVMVGDTEYDMDMAKRAGVPRIGVSYGAHAADRLYQYEPLAVVDHLSEIQVLRESTI